VALTGGAAYSWGDNGFGDLAWLDDHLVAPSAVIAHGGAGGQDPHAITAAGEYSTFAQDTAVGHCWGLNSAGQLGTGSVRQRSGCRDHQRGTAGKKQKK